MIDFFDYYADAVLKFCDKSHSPIPMQSSAEIISATK